MKIIWEDSAYQELNQAISFIAKKSPQNALMVLDGLIELADSLIDFPEKYPVEPIYNKINIRFVTLFNHKLIYQIESDRVIILRVFPGRMNPERLSNPDL